jgi:ribosomal protein S18 acetylase RimI-like enzyme
MGSATNSELKLKYRKIKIKERKKFYEYAFESTREFAENEIGVSFNVLNKFLFIDRLLFGIPLKLVMKNNEDIVLTHNGEIAAGFSTFYDKKEDEYHLGNVFTRPLYQGKGVGNSLTRYVIKNFGSKKIDLSVNKKNDVARHLYLKYGFKDKSISEEFIFDLPLKTKLLPDGYTIRLAEKEDLQKLDRIKDEVPKMKDLSNVYKKAFGKTKKKFYRMQNHLPVVLINNNDGVEEIQGIGRAIWTKAIPDLAQLIATAVLPEAKKAYPSFISSLSNETMKYGLKRGSWERTDKTEHFFEEMKPFLGEPLRTGYKMEFIPDQE